MYSFSDYYQAVIVPASILIPVCVAVLNYRYIYRSVKILVLYLIVSGCINLAAILNSHSNNLTLLHIYTIIEFVLLVGYFIVINTSKRILNVSYFLVTVFPLLCIINMFFLQSRFRHNSYVRPIECIILMGYCLLY